MSGVRFNIRELEILRGLPQWETEEREKSGVNARVKQIGRAILKELNPSTSTHSIEKRFTLFTEKKVLVINTRIILDPYFKERGQQAISLEASHTVTYEARGKGLFYLLGTIYLVFAAFYYKNYSSTNTKRISLPAPPIFNSNFDQARRARERSQRAHGGTQPGRGTHAHSQQNSNPGAHSYQQRNAPSRPSSGFFQGKNTPSEKIGHYNYHYNFSPGFALRPSECDTLKKSICSTLNLPESSTFEEIKTAYRRLARQAHTDKGGEKEAFQLIQSAYQAASGLHAQGKLP